MNPKLRRVASAITAAHASRQDGIAAILPAPDDANSERALVIRRRHRAEIGSASDRTPSVSSPGRLRRWISRATTVAITALVTTATAWALSTVTTPKEDPTAGEAYAFATVREGEVGATLILNAIASWAPSSTAYNQATGIVTSVPPDPGTEVHPGDELFAVDLRPVVAASGEVPAFRDLGRDMDGADIEQLQALLASLGHYDGTVDGVARDATDRAIRAWQKDIGVPETGVVEVGSIVFLPTLPARISLDREVVARGKRLDGGEPVILTLSPAPEVTVPATPAQSALIPTEATVTLNGSSGELWTARVGERRRDPETDQVDITLTSVDGKAICGDECGAVPVGGETVLDATITTAETVSGLILPAAAIVTEAGGGLAVIDDAGRRRPITVLASANGMSVVEGVAENVRVRIPATVDETTR